MNRRQWLICSALTAASLWLARRSAADRAKHPEESILVIGAGVAGLGAAWELKRLGYTSVTLLEARDRAGGRVSTGQGWADAPVDLGASWIHGVRGNPITRLAKQHGIKTQATDYDNLQIYGPDGHPIDRAKQRQLNDLSTTLYRAVMGGGGKDRSLRSLIDDAVSGRPDYDPILVNYLVNTMVEQPYAADSEDLAAGVWNLGKEFGGNDVLFPGGYMQVFSPGLEELDIRIDQKVKSVHYDDQGVRVRTQDTELTADRAIITLPLGVLQKGYVDFTPELPAAKQGAISSLGMGVLNKTFLRFPKPFWPTELEGLSRIPKMRGQWSQWLSLYPYTQKPILLGFNAGSFGREIEGWAGDAIVDSAMEALRSIFGSSIPTPTGYQTTRWACDPLAYGSYSYQRVGAKLSSRDELARPVGDRLFFAGEATHSDYPSTVHGAYLSGQREAQRIAWL